MNTTHRRIAVALSTALLVGGTFPTTAFSDTPAELQTQLDTANAQLDALYASAEAASNELNKTLDDLTATQADIEDTAAQIDSKQTELASAQRRLERMVAASYKDGSVSLLSIFRASKDFEDFVSRIHYANKVSESYSQQIQEVKEIQEDLIVDKASLEAQQAELEQLRDAQERQRAQLVAKANEAESYVAGLSSELQEALAAEAAARAEAARAEAAAALESAGGSESTGAVDASSANVPVAAPKEQATDERKDTAEQQRETTSQDGEEQKEEKKEEPQEEPNEQKETDSSPSEDTSSRESDTSTPAQQSANTDARAAVVNYVLAQVGKPYVWATHGPDSFDCSGLTGAAYEQIGLFVGYSDSYQVQYCNKPASEAVYGDIVWRPGHVGLCIGSGVTVEAFNPSRGVGYGSVDSFQLSGSPLS